MLEWLFMSIFTTIFNSDEKLLKEAKAAVKKINALEDSISKLSNDELRMKTSAFRAQLGDGKTLEDILPEAFAVVRETAKRVLGERHYDVQLIGGYVLHHRGIAEMRTGEGKTLVATLPAYLNALTGLGVHAVTVNDYLAQRDAVWMAKVYDALGLTVGVINDQNQSYRYDANHTVEASETDDFKIKHEFLKPVSRKEAYLADITYGTNSQFGFDYLRDNLITNVEQIVQRGHHYALIDEVDSILIDEARTPLIISSPSQKSEDFYKTFARIASALVVNTDYTVDEKHRSVQLTDAGITRAEELLGISDIYTEKGIKYVHHLETAVRAQALYVRDRDYVVKDGDVTIVDPFTGRMQPGRRWSEGLHQAVEAKEGVRIQEESRAVATITYQNFFKLYNKFGGMTGTAKTSAEEFLKVYGLEVVSIPTHRVNQRSDHNDQIFQSETGKWKAIARKVKVLQESGQPVLIGTISIERNELLSAYLKSEGVPHNVLNAKNHEHEGELIAQAGTKGAVTVATNLAGRGIDIKLGGSPTTTEKHDEVKALGGLFVLGTERHEARRIDNQLRGRSGRQGDPGATQFFVSLEDDLMRVFGSDRVKSMMGKLGIPEDQPIENSFISRALENAQKRIEGFHFDARRYTLEYDNVMNHQRTAIYGRRRAMLLADRAKILEYLEELYLENPELEQIVSNKIKALGEDAFYESLRRIVLYTTDVLWTEHIETMEYLRSSIGLRAYGQREPLVEYKKEGLRLFKDMEASARSEVAVLIEKLGTENAPVRTESVTVSAPAVAFVEGKGSDLASPGEKSAVREGTVRHEEEKIGRNDACPCGSGKKWKKCGDLNTEEHQRLMATKDH